MKISTFSIFAVVSICSALSADGAPKELNRKRVGSWDVTISEPDPGRLVKRLSAQHKDFAIDLYCQGDHWRLYISRFSDADTAEIMSAVQLRYAIDNSTVRTATGVGHPRYRFEIHSNADLLISELAGTHHLFRLAIEPTRTLTAIPLDKTREAVGAFASECPLKAEKRS